MKNMKKLMICLLLAAGSFSFCGQPVSGDVAESSATAATEIEATAPSTVAEVPAQEPTNVLISETSVKEVADIPEAVKADNAERPSDPLVETTEVLGVQEGGTAGDFGAADDLEQTLTDAQQEELLQSLNLEGETDDQTVCDDATTCADEVPCDSSCASV